MVKKKVEIDIRADREIKKALKRFKEHQETL